MSTAVEVPAMDLIGPDDGLTEAQAIRLYEAIGLGKAALAALDAGMSPSELELQEWLVDVDLLQPEPVQHRQPRRKR